MKSNPSLTFPSIFQQQKLRAMLPILQQLQLDDMEAVPFEKSAAYDNLRSRWEFSPDNTDYDLWCSLRRAAKKSTADVRLLTDCSEWFAAIIREATDEEIRRLSLRSVSCFRCALSDEELFEMIDRVESGEAEIEVRSAGVDAFIDNFWRTAFKLFTHDKVLCRSFMNLSENASNRLYLLCGQQNKIYDFIRMKGHKFQLACNERLFSYMLKTDMYSREEDK